MSSDWSTNYRQDGVVSGVRVLPEGEADVRLQELDAIRENILARPDACLSDLSHLHYVEGDHPLFPWVDRLARDERLLGPVRALLGPDVLIRNGDVFAKEPDPLHWVPIPGFVSTGQGIGWHRDDIGEEHDPQPFLTLWLALTLANETNGSLRYRKGSHRVKLPRPPADRGDLTMRRENLAVLEKCDELVVSLEPGECVLHGGFVVHSSEANQCPRRRVGLAIRYMRADADPVLAGCGTASLACGSGDASSFSLQDNYTINWWSPPAAASGRKEVLSAVPMRWAGAPGTGGHVVVEWETPEAREAVQGLGACIPGTSAHVWVNGAPESLELDTSFALSEGKLLVVVVYRNGTHSRESITREP